MNFKKMYFKVIKSGTNRKLVYDFLEYAKPLDAKPQTDFNAK